MKRIYHFYLTCMTLTLTMPMMIVSAFAVDDMWTVANNIIVDVYGKIVGVSTVLAGLMSAVAVIGAKLSNTICKTPCGRKHRRKLKKPRSRLLRKRRKEGCLW